MQKYYSIGHGRTLQGFVSTRCKHGLPLPEGGVRIRLVRCLTECIPQVSLQGLQCDHLDISQSTLFPFGLWPGPQVADRFQSELSSLSSLFSKNKYKINYHIRLLQTFYRLFLITT